MAEARRTLSGVRHFLETVKRLFQMGNKTETLPSLSRCQSFSATRAARVPLGGPPESAGLPQPRCDAG
ncbi:Hypp2750 [Branchiostoma lanceolatum]|uniref:Hypp2750 protein n=1 Tax=Branchiostoma lanceolatum TaxID=7740 RepID=A0A8K0EPF2_BRALA|nr:Hypp2750 [Branchiostoma lanceolatum]